MIGIDYTPAYEQGGGIGRYVRELTLALAQVDSKTAYQLFVAGASKNALPAPPGPNFTFTPTPISNAWLARIWHRARLSLPVEVFTGPLDLYHATDFVLPPTRQTSKTLLTVHDLSFVRTPETAATQLRRYLNQVVPRSVTAADHILADSEATKADLITLYNTPPDKVTVLLSGVNNRFAPVNDPQVRNTVRKKYSLDDWPYIFSIGTVQPRKNYARYVEALAVLRAHNPDLHLVIAGGRGWLEDSLYKAIEDHHMADYVHLIGFVDDADLPALYSAAVCTVFISLYEGFGFPVLESMACGTPVITSNVSSLPEVAGSVAPMVDPTDLEAIIEALRPMLEDPTYRNQLRQQGLRHVKNFTWNRAAQQLLDVYQRLLA